LLHAFNFEVAPIFFATFVHRSGKHLTEVCVVFFPQSIRANSEIVPRLGQERLLLEYFELMNGLVILRCYAEMLAVLSNEPQTTTRFEIINIKLVQCQLSIKNQRHRFKYLTLDNG
jgi:hypothetical protein